MNITNKINISYKDKLANVLKKDSHNILLTFHSLGDKNNASIYTKYCIAKEAVDTFLSNCKCDYIYHIGFNRQQIPFINLFFNQRFDNSFELNAFIKDTWSSGLFMAINLTTHIASSKFANRSPYIKNITKIIDKQCLIDFAYYNCSNSNKAIIGSISDNETYEAFYYYEKTFVKEEKPPIEKEYIETFVKEEKPPIEKEYIETFLKEEKPPIEKEYIDIEAKFNIGDIEAEIEAETSIIFSKTKSKLDFNNRFRPQIILNAKTKLDNIFKSLLKENKNSKGIYDIYYLKVIALIKTSFSICENQTSNSEKIIFLESMFNMCKTELHFYVLPLTYFLNIDKVFQEGLSNKLETEILEPFKLLLSLDVNKQEIDQNYESFNNELNKLKADTGLFIDIISSIKKDILLAKQNKIKDLPESRHFFKSK